MTAVTAKQRQRAALFTFHFPYMRAEQIGNLGVGQVQGFQEWRRGKQAPSGDRAIVRCTTPHCLRLRQGQGAIDENQVGGRSRPRMISLKPTEESPLGPRPRL